MTSRCRSCGGRDFTDAIDNHGKAYRGCARCSVAPAVKPRRWRKVGPHEYTLRMGPVTIEVIDKEVDDQWRWQAVTSGGVMFLWRDRFALRPGIPRAQCQADAIAAVERWRDGIR